MARRAVGLVGVSRAGEMAVYASVEEAQAQRAALLDLCRAQGAEPPSMDVLVGAVSNRAVERGSTTRFTVIGPIDPLRTFLAPMIPVMAGRGTDN